MLKNIAVILLMIIATVAADAQQRTAVRTAVQVQNDTRFTSEFQQAMESGNYGHAATLVRSGNATRGSGLATGRRTYEPVRASAATSSATSLTANTPPPDTADYTCNGGNCACAGASDCVAMAPICEEGTIGCNDYGCTCKEAD
ncbi:hypothetical protein [Hyphobacterium sp.]|uniref:hypothetical protein n=1 Tax=Hyphobacterium sp. TaxID=2004662 RepID=UPI003BA91012